MLKSCFFVIINVFIIITIIAIFLRNYAIDIHYLCQNIEYQYNRIKYAGQFQSLINVSTIRTKSIMKSTNIEKILNESYTRYNSFLNDITNGSILIVGGTDGSGTRSVVKLLADLGVAMVVEDPNTYDIHAVSVGGWSQLIRPIIKKYHSTYYDINNFTFDDFNHTMADIKIILSQAEIDVKKRQSYRFKVGGSLSRPKGRRALGVKFGFKAPIAMTLLPAFAEYINYFKFLHVIRDGRDIAYSSNQGPVRKYYDLMYGNDSYSKELKAVRLWSDWNTGVYHWSMNYMTNMSRPNNFNYLKIHTEDLVSDDVNIRYAAMLTLAKWVNSNLTNDEICCLATSHLKFLGSHDRSTKSGNISSRYGKWKKFTNNNQQLLVDLHSFGQPGLKLFGYVPSVNRYNISDLNVCYSTITNNNISKFERYNYKSNNICSIFT